MTESPEASTPAPSSAPTKTVVVAEDEALIRMDIVEMLREAGYNVVAEAENGQRAVDLAREHTPDLVLMDVKMPVMDGITAAEHIAEERIAPVVLLTAFSQRELVERAREAGPWRMWSSHSPWMTWCRPLRSPCPASRRSPRSRTRSRT